MINKMDSNIPQQPPASPVAPTAPIPPQSTVPQAPPSVIPPVSPEGSSSNKLVMFLIAGIIVIGVSVGGIYLYLNQKQASDLQTSKTPVVSTPLPVAEQENLEGDLNNINIATDDADFTPIDQDIQGL